MSPQESYRRTKAVKLANSINEIEGAPVSSSAKLLSARWAKGEISGTEMKATLLNAHRQPQQGASR